MWSKRPGLGLPERTSEIRRHALRATIGIATIEMAISGIGRAMPCRMTSSFDAGQRVSLGERKLRFVTQPRRSHSRGLTMPPGRRIPRPPDTPPERPPPPAESDVSVPADVAKAAGELAALAIRIRACEGCGPADAPRAYGTGFARATVMLLKDVPSAEDLDTGNAFAAETPALTKAFDALAIPIAWVYGTSAVKSTAGGASPEELGPCAAHLLTEIEAVQPRVIVAFGRASVAALLGLDGRCGLSVPAEIRQGEPASVRADLTVVATEALPEGVTGRDAKRRLWRDLQVVPSLLK